MSPLKLAALACSLAAGLGASAALAQAGTITAYKSDALRTYTREGQPGPRLTRNQLPPLRATIVEVRPGGLMGVDTPGSGRVYLRGIDLEFVLSGEAAPRCTEVAATGRGAGQVVGGTSAGGGTTRDCRVR